MKVRVLYDYVLKFNMIKVCC